MHKAGHTARRAALRSSAKIRPSAQPNPSGDTAARWKTCLHEAGHAVAGRVLLKRTTRALVFDDQCGAAYLDRDGRCPRTYEDALAIAAGQAAEVLAHAYPPPQMPPAAPLEATYPESAKPLLAQVRSECVSDAVALARWCIQGVEAQPDRWSIRHSWIHRDAATFIARNQQEIVNIAAALYGRGIITLPAEPAEEELNHVD